MVSGSASTGSASRESTPTAGRRERNTRDKQARIFSAAASLFAEQGFDAVSTGSVAERADVAAGTVFRYASSKGELLLMVLNDEFRTLLDDGSRRSAETSDVARAIVQIVQPILEYAFAHPANGAAYQRELLFGRSDDRYRAEGLELVADLQQRIATRLSDEAQALGLTPDPDRALLVANMIFGVANLAVARPTTGAHTDRDALSDIQTQVRIAVDGYVAGLHAP